MSLQGVVIVIDMRKFYSSPDTRRIYADRPRPKYSYGHSVPRNGLQACLCADKLTYSRKCCKGYLINQGIGSTISPYPTGGGFSIGFSNGFQVVS
jgi:hypothetical protein